MDFKISSDAFAYGENIPRKYTGEGEDISPPLNWSGIPEGTESFVLICDDPDAPGGTWLHWLVFNMPAKYSGLDEGASSAGLPEDTLEGSNDFGKTAYGGPMPPPGPAHRYFFRIYALDTKLNMEEGASRQEVEKAMRGHVLADTYIIGLYQR